MSHITYEQVLSQVRALPPEDVAKLRDFLNAQDEQDAIIENSRSSVRKVVMRDYSAERRWLSEHADEYAGQWVALKGDQLISSGPDLREVYEAARMAGHPDALLEQVEADDAAPFIF